MGKIDESTVIQFNLKWFIGIIVTIVSFFVTFYFTVQKPNNDGVMNFVEQRFQDQEKYQELKFEKLDEMNSKLTDMERNIDALKRRSDDLFELRSTIDNTGGQLGN